MFPFPNFRPFWGVAISSTPAITNALPLSQPATLALRRPGPAGFTGSISMVTTWSSMISAKRRVGILGVLGHSMEGRYSKQPLCRSGPHDQPIPLQQSHLLKSPSFLCLYIYIYITFNRGWLAFRNQICIKLALFWAKHSEIRNVDECWWTILAVRFPKTSQNLMPHLTWSEAQNGCR